MRLKQMALTLLLGASTLAVAISCDKKKDPTNPYPFDGTYTATSVKTTPSTISVQGTEVNIQELFLGDALMKLGTINTIKIEQGKYELINKEGKTFPGAQTQAGELKVNAKGTLLMKISGMPKELSIGNVTLQDKRLMTEITFSALYLQSFADLYKFTRKVPDTDPIYLALKALAASDQRVTINIEATK